MIYEIDDREYLTDREAWRNKTMVNKFASHLVNGGAFEVTRVVEGDFEVLFAYGGSKYLTIISKGDFIKCVSLC